MTEKQTIQTSKFLSLILRHEPQRVGLQLGEAGWIVASNFQSSSVNQPKTPRKPKWEGECPHEPERTKDSPQQVRVERTQRFKHPPHFEAFRTR